MSAQALWSSYLDALAELATENTNVAFLDLSLRTPDGTDTTYGLYTDQVHFTAKGYRYLADTITAFLTQDVQRGKAATPLVKGQTQPIGSRTGLYYGSTIETQATVAFGLNNLKCSPISLPRAGTLDRIACEVVTLGTGALIRLFIYEDDGHGAPGALLLDAGTVDASTIGWKEATISKAVTPGQYWVGTVSVGTADATLRAMTGANNAVGMVSLTAALAQGGFQGTYSGSLPARWPALANAGAVPRVVVRYA